METPNYLGRYLTGFTVLLLGAAAYFVDRPVDEVYFLPAWLEQFQTVTGGLHDSLPSLAHAFAFTLFTLLFIGPVTSGIKSAICGGWWLLEAGLEAIQHPGASDLAAVLTPNWLIQLPILEALPAYAQQGTFDWYDILFAGLGCLTAYCIAPHFPRRPQSIQPFQPSPETGS